uniref:Uncharacterized protein n=1 Tax=Meloidogyne floridensis TaxID=298350 RepID=A0A915NVA1_9BILA
MEPSATTSQGLLETDEYLSELATSIIKKRRSADQNTATLGDRSMKRSQANSANAKYEKLQALIDEYVNRSWPKLTKTGRISLMNRSPVRCMGECECTSFAQCHQTAASYIAVLQYLTKHQTRPCVMPKLKGGKITKGCYHKHHCASAGALHKIPYYDSGSFGDAFCEHCSARLLKSEAILIKKGRKSPCCHGGKSHNDQMREEFEELQTPPKILGKELAGAKDEQIREEFLNNTMTLNNTYAFASVGAEKAPAEQMGGRMDTCKYNGEFSFLFSDLIAPQGRRPTSAQVYTLMPEAAVELREQNVIDALSRTLKHLIMLKMEELMRANPFGQTFQTAGAKMQEYKE